MAETNPNSRLEAFCDGVFAIAITLLVIEIRPPSTQSITSSADLWRALGHLAPSIFTFLLSFTIILIAWVNHHAVLKLVNRSSPAFTYSNGFILLTVAFLPFPTALMGEFLFTEHAAPAVVLFVSVIAIQALAWTLLSKAALSGHLTKNDRSTAAMRTNQHFSTFAFIFYSMCAVAAFWLPLLVAILTTVIWVFWLLYGIRIRAE